MHNFFAFAIHAGIQISRRVRSISNLVQAFREPSQHARKSRPCCLTPAEIMEDRVLLSGFTDGFEGTSLNSFWSTYLQSGSISLTSTTPHSGSQSVQFDSVDTGIDKFIFLEHTFEKPVYGTFSVWVFDSGAGLDSSSYIGFQLDQIGTNARNDIFGKDYDFGGDTYTLGPNDTDNFSTGVLRTPGWHQFLFDITPTLTVFEIDGSSVFTTDGIPMDHVVLFMQGPSWRPEWTTFFDDFQFIPATDLDVTATAACSAIEGTPAKNITLLTFSDANPNVTAGNFSVSNVNWGTTLVGVTPSLSIVPNLAYTGPGSSWNVVANNVTYAEAGTYPVSITLNDSDGSSVDVSGITFNVTDAALMDTTPINSIPATEGVAKSGVTLMTFADGNPQASIADFSIKQLGWGGPLTGPAPIVSIIKDPAYSGPGSGWKVIADNTAYREPGRYTVSVTVHDRDGSDVSATHTSFNVADAPLGDLTTKRTWTSVEGHNTNSVVLMTFIDENPYASVADYTVNVNWGGQTVGAPIAGLQRVSVSTAGSVWEVVGSTIYPEEGLFTLNVQVRDSDGAVVQSSQTKVSVVDAPIFDTTPARTLLATRGKSTGAVVLATFTDLNPYATAADYRIGVIWGTPVAGPPPVSLILVSRSAGGSNWAVVTNVLFLVNGTFMPDVFINDSGGSSLHVKKTTFKVIG
ncbi:MAG: hypothetical protein JSS02_09215 [Planctomycetes bacterium]|nr:hypothetical protein [Planctomycetota bacterium]